MQVLWLLRRHVGFLLTFLLRRCDEVDAQDCRLFVHKNGENAALGEPRDALQAKSIHSIAVGTSDPPPPFLFAPRPSPPSARATKSSP